MMRRAIFGAAGFSKLVSLIVKPTRVATARDPNAI
jgi:hypothetical protein